MDRRHSMRSFFAGMMSAVLLGTLVLSAGAALKSKGIQVYTGMEIFVDGVKMDPRDANGKSVETFAYNGTTYVPLRAVSQSLGKDVSYDGKTQRVYIGTNPNTTKYLMDVCPPYQVSNTYQVRSLANTSDKNRTMGGRQYGNGIYMYAGYGTENNALFNLDGQYDSLTATVGHVDGSGSVDVNLFFYVDDVLKASFTIGSEDLPKDVIIPLDGGLQLKVLAKASGGSSSVNVANMIVK